VLEFLSGFISKCNQSMDTFHICILSILILKFSKKRLFILGKVIVISMIKLVHLVGNTVRVIPDE